jgi:hypothetical protein
MLVSAARLAGTDRLPGRLFHFRCPAGVIGSAYLIV